MSDSDSIEKEVMEGGKKSNGHKTDCECPICKNMIKKKSGGNKYLELKKNISTGMFLFVTSISIRNVLSHFSTKSADIRNPEIL